MAEKQKNPDNNPADRLFTLEDEGKLRARMAIKQLLEDVVAQNRGPLPTITSIELEPLLQRISEVFDQLDHNFKLSEEDRHELLEEYWKLATTIEHLEPQFKIEQEQAEEEFNAGMRGSAQGGTVFREHKTPQ